MWVENEYTTLVSSSNSTKFHFMSFLWAVLSHLMELHGIVGGMGESFSIDNAVGNQLDVLGALVGLPRLLPVSIATPIYIDGVAYYTNEMTDDEYRTAIQLKIAQNCWDGSNQNAYDLYKHVFGDEMQIEQEDNMDSSVSIKVYGTSNARMVEIMSGGNLFLIPSGIGKSVEVIDTDIPVNTYVGYDVTSITVVEPVQMIEGE